MQEKNVPMNGKYLYGFVQVSDVIQFDIAGMDQKMLHTIPHRDIAAVVSDTVPIIWSDLPRETVFSCLTTHQAAIEAVMARYEIIPAKFGTFLPNENLVHLILKTEYQLIRSSLAEMANQVELDVVVLWRDPATVFEQIGKLPEIMAIKDQIQKEGPAECHNLKIQAGIRVKETLDAMNTKCANETKDALASVSMACQPHEVRDDVMILNCAFLIEKKQQDAFEKQIDDLDNRHHNQLTFRLIGPLPPYSFKTLEIERLNTHEVEDARILFCLGKTATESEIRARYREMAKTLHPDRFPKDSSSQNRFESLNKAYDILKTYCRGDACSFESADIQNWVAVREMKYSAGTR